MIHPPGVEYPAPSARQAGRDQLAAELMGLIGRLRRELDHYLAVQSDCPADESVRLLNDSAAAWMQESLHDLEATVVGLEAAAAGSRGR